MKYRRIAIKNSIGVNIDLRYILVLFKLMSYSKYRKILKKCTENPICIKCFGEAFEIKSISHKYKVT